MTRACAWLLEPRDGSIESGSGSGITTTIWSHKIKAQVTSIQPIIEYHSDQVHFVKYCLGCDLEANLGVVFHILKSYCMNTGLLLSFGSCKLHMLYIFISWAHVLHAPGWS